MRGLLLVLLLAGCATPARANYPFFPPDECAQYLPNPDRLHMWGYGGRPSRALKQRVKVTQIIGASREYGQETKLLACNPRGQHVT